MLVETMSTAKGHRPSSEHHRSVVGREVGEGQEEPVPASRHRDAFEQFGSGGELGELSELSVTVVSATIK